LPGLGKPSQGAGCTFIKAGAGRWSPELSEKSLPLSGVNPISPFPADAAELARALAQPLPAAAISLFWGCVWLFHFFFYSSPAVNVR